MRKIIYAFLVFVLAGISIFVNHIGGHESGSKTIMLEIVHISSHLVLAGSVLTLALLEKFAQSFFEKYQNKIQKLFGFLTGTVMLGIFYMITGLQDEHHRVNTYYAIGTTAIVTLLSLIQIGMLHRISKDNCDLPCHDGVKYHLFVDVTRNVFFVIALLFFKNENIDNIFSCITKILMLFLTLKVFYRTVNFSSDSSC